MSVFNYVVRNYYDAVTLHNLYTFNNRFDINNNIFNFV